MHSILVPDYRRGGDAIFSTAPNCCCAVERIRLAAVVTQATVAQVILSVMDLQDNLLTFSMVNSMTIMSSSMKKPKANTRERGERSNSKQ